MNPSFAAAVGINVLSSFVHDLVIRASQGSQPSPIGAAIANTVEKFPQIEGLKQTLEEWLGSPGVLGELNKYARGLKGYDDVRIDTLSIALVGDTRFFLPDGAEAAAHEIVAFFFVEIRDQYLRTPELAMPLLANRIEEQITISQAGFASLQSGLRELRDTAADALDLQIDEAKDHLESHEYEIARDTLKKLRRTKWDQMSPRQRFRVLSNLAMIDLQQGKLNEAAKLFVEAREFQPDDGLAVANEALAHFLLHDSSRAFDLADRAKARFPTSGRALMVWLNTAPATFSPDQLEDAIPPSLAADAEVLMALAFRALMARDTAKAEEIARRAIAAKSDWSCPWALLGESIFRSQLPDNAEDYAEARPPRDTPRLAEAVEACTKAFELAKKEKHLGIEGAALLVRAEARRLLGEASADEDIIAAYNIQPDDPTILNGYACMKIRLGQNREAIEKLRSGTKRHARADLRMLLAFALSATGEPKDRTEAIQIFSSLAADQDAPSAEFRTQAAIAAVGNLAEAQRWDEARAFLSQLPRSSISSTALAALQGRIELSAGERQKASEFGTQANASISEATRHEDIRLTARFLADLGRHRDALPLWQRLASPTRLGNDSCRLIDSTLRLGEHRLLLEFCEQLRLNGIYDAQFIGLEAGIREQYDIEGTIALLQEYLSRAPDDRNIRLQLSVIGIQHGRPELISSDPSSMPRPEDTPPENWMAIVLVMKSGGHLWEALKLAYRLLRLNFGKIEAHRAYFASLLPTDPRPALPTPTVVEPGTAVAFTEEGASQTQWVIIEEELEPDAKLQEIGPSHPTAQQLIGKREGEAFLVAEGSVVSRRAKISQILSKYAFRYADCGENWMRRFPDHPDVQVVRTAPRPGAPGGIDLTEFFQTFDRIIALHHEALQAYRSQPIPIHILALARGRSDLEETMVLASDDASSVRCCLGSAEERSAAVLALRNAAAIALDLTAIATISSLDAFDQLKQFQARLLVPEPTIAAIQSLAQEYDTETGRTGLGREGHRYVMSEMTPEAVRVQREHLESLIDNLRSRCTIVPCLELAGIPREKREFLTKAAGEHGAQSIMLATIAGNVLWTDDFGMALLAAHEFGVRRVWTQVALQERVEAGRLSADFFTDATSKLLGWRYYFTSTGVQSLARAGEIAGWNPDRWPFKGALDVFSDRAILTRDVLSLAVSFMLHYAGEVALPQVREAVTVRILDRLSGRREGLVAVAALLRAVPGSFGLNVLRSAEITAVVNAWFANRMTPLR